MALASIIESLLGTDLPVAVRAYDGSSIGPPDPPATIYVRSPDALRRIITSPGELGFARAYVAGDLDLEGDIFAGPRAARPAAQRQAPSATTPGVGARARLAQLAAVCPHRRKKRTCTVRRHSVARDRAAISHHYDVSNEFYRLFLGPSLTYSCAVFSSDDMSLEDAQASKYELVSRKLDLQPGMRLLDVGCGWGGMVMHAAERTRRVRGRRDGVQPPGRAGLEARRRSGARRPSADPQPGLPARGRRSLRRHLVDRHVRTRRRGQAGRVLRSALRPASSGRSSAQPRHQPAAESGRQDQRQVPRRGFIDRYVFPDGELHEIGRVVSIVQQAGFEVRHVESLREHYAQDAAALGRQPRGPLGRGSRARRAAACADLAPLHGRLRGELRGEPHADPSGARGEARQGTFGHAAATLVGQHAADRRLDNVRRVPRARDFTFLDWPGPIPFAHRGGASEVPENTMPAFEHAIAPRLPLHRDRRARHVRRRAARVPRRRARPGHRRQRRRSKSCRGRSVRDAKVDGREPIPLFEDLLGAWPDVRVNIDPKHDDAVEPLVAVLAEVRCRRPRVHRRVQRRTARARARTCCRAVHVARPEGTLQLGLAAQGDDVPELPAPCVQVPTHYLDTEIVTPAFLEAAHRRGMQVHVWTIDDADEMARLLDLGVDGIMTDRPKVLRDVLEQRGQWTS